MESLERQLAEAAESERIDACEHTDGRTQFGVFCGIQANERKLSGVSPSTGNSAQTPFSRLSPSWLSLEQLYPTLSATCSTQESITALHDILISACPSGDHHLCFLLFPPLLSTCGCRSLAIPPLPPPVPFRSAPPRSATPFRNPKRRQGRDPSLLSSRRGTWPCLFLRPLRSSPADNGRSSLSKAHMPPRVDPIPPP